jgi:hypothetical protein
VCILWVEKEFKSDGNRWHAKFQRVLKPVPGVFANFDIYGMNECVHQTISCMAVAETPSDRSQTINSCSIKVAAHIVEIRDTERILLVKQNVPSNLQHVISKTDSRMMYFSTDDVSPVLYNPRG